MWPQRWRRTGDFAETMRENRALRIRIGRVIHVIDSAAWPLTNFQRRVRYRGPVHRRSGAVVYQPEQTED